MLPQSAAFAPAPYSGTTSVTLLQHGCPLKPRPASEPGNYAHGFRCDLCGQGSTPQRWHCATHGYDVCQTCLLQRLSNCAPIAQPFPVQPTCQFCGGDLLPDPRGQYSCPRFCSAPPKPNPPRPPVMMCGVSPNLQQPGIPCCHDQVQAIVDRLCQSVGKTIPNREAFIDAFATQCANKAMSVDDLTRDISAAIGRI